jgi:hypothetical protein
MEASQSTAVRYLYSDRIASGEIIQQSRYFSDEISFEQATVCAL